LQRRVVRRVKGLEVGARNVRLDDHNKKGGEVTPALYAVYCLLSTDFSTFLRPFRRRLREVHRRVYLPSPEFR
jgi:hypothetical protein